jgi:hypothetical protein
MGTRARQGSHGGAETRRRRAGACRFRTFRNQVHHLCSAGGAPSATYTISATPGHSGADRGRTEARRHGGALKGLCRSRRSETRFTACARMVPHLQRRSRSQRRPGTRARTEERTEARRRGGDDQGLVVQDVPKSGSPPVVACWARSATEPLSATPEHSGADGRSHGGAETRRRRSGACRSRRSETRFTTCGRLLGTFSDGAALSDARALGRGRRIAWRRVDTEER